MCMHVQARTWSRKLGREGKSDLRQCGKGEEGKSGYEKLSEYLKKGGKLKEHSAGIGVRTGVGETSIYAEVALGGVLIQRV